LNARSLDIGLLCLVDIGADIEQMTLGHKWINDTFGSKFLPRIGWQIDAQGNLGSQAAMMALIGFDAHVPNRIPVKPLVSLAYCCSLLPLPYYSTFLAHLIVV
jgi:hypothetical protein